MHVTHTEGTDRLSYSWQHPREEWGGRDGGQGLSYRWFPLQTILKAMSRFRPHNGTSVPANSCVNLWPHVTT